MSQSIISLQSPPSPDADTLVRRLHERLRTAAARRERSPGECLEAGDDIQCDLLTVVEGRILPGSAQKATLLELRPFVHLPGLYEGILRIPVFSAATVPLTLPPDYPVAGYAGASAHLYVEVRRAWAVDMPALDDTQALKNAGLGSSPEEAMQRLADDLEAELADELLLEATQSVLDRVAAETTVEGLAEKVDAELLRQWQRGDGDFLAEKGFSSEIQASARADFLADPGLRAQAERQIRIHAGLGARIERQQLQVAPDCADDLLQQVADSMGLELSHLKKALADDPVAAREVAYTALYLTAVRQAVAEARFEVVDPGHT